MLELFSAKTCYKSYALKGVLDLGDVNYDLQVVEANKPSALPFSVYGQTPVLRDGDRVVEDLRAQLLYLDETYFEREYLDQTPAERSKLFDHLEVLLADILPALFTPVLVYPKLEELKVTPAQQLAAKQRLFLELPKEWRASFDQAVGEVSAWVDIVSKLGHAKIISYPLLGVARAVCDYSEFDDLFERVPGLHQLSGKHALDGNTPADNQSDP